MRIQIFLVGISRATNYATKSYDLVVSARLMSVVGLCRLEADLHVINVWRSAQREKEREKRKSNKEKGR